MATPRKVLYLETSPNRYGSTISLVTLIKGLDRSRFEPHVMMHRDNAALEELAALDVACVGLALETPPPSLRPAGAAPAPTSRPGAGPRTWPSSAARLARDLVFYRNEIAAMARYIRKQGIDVVHLNDQPSSNRFAYLAVPRGAPIVQHVRTGPLSDSPYVRLVSRRARRFICISRYVADCVRESVSAEGALAVIYNPVDDLFFEDVETIADRRGRTGSEFVFAQIGRYVPYKGPDIFLEAFSRIAKSPPAGVRVRAQLLGGEMGISAFEQQLRAIVERNGLQDAVEFLPYRNDVKGFLDGIGCLVHCTREPEGFGRVVAEALAAGCPVIASRQGALPELVRDGETGLNADGADELEAAMRRMMADASLRRTMALNARRDAMRYNAAYIADQVMAVYDELDRR